MTLVGHPVRIQDSDPFHPLVTMRSQAVEAVFQLFLLPARTSAGTWLRTRR
jgi:hypothetical protein